RRARLRLRVLMLRYLRRPRIGLARGPWLWSSVGRRIVGWRRMTRSVVRPTTSRCVMVGLAAPRLGATLQFCCPESVLARTATTAQHQKLRVEVDPYFKPSKHQVRTQYGA